MSIIHLEQPSSTDSPGLKPKTVAATADAAKNLITTMGTGLNHIDDEVTVIPKSTYSNISISTSVATGTGNLFGILINSHSSGTIKVWDSLAASGTVLANTITLAVGERFIDFKGATFGTGLYITIGGTADITVFYKTNV